MAQDTYTDEDDVGKVDDDYGRSDEQLATQKRVPVENDGQCERDGASKSAVRHDKLTDPVDLR